MKTVDFNEPKEREREICDILTLLGLPPSLCYQTKNLLAVTSEIGNRQMLPLGLNLQLKRIFTCQCSVCPASPAAQLHITDTHWTD